MPKTIVSGAMTLKAALIIETCKGIRVVGIPSASSSRAEPMTMAINAPNHLPACDGPRASRA
jgi:hypothetical protein